MPRVGFLIVLLLVSTAHAEDSKSKSRQHFKRGVERYNSGDYDAALTEYEAAYSAMPLPALLFNMGQCYRMKGQKQSAIDHYKRYLAAEPLGPASDEARTHVAVLTKQISDEAKAADARERAEKAKAEADAKAEAEAQQPGVVIVAPVEKTEDKKPVTKRAWFWAVIGVGAVLVVGAAVTTGVVLGGNEVRYPSTQLGRVDGN